MKLKDIHDMLSETLEIANRHASLLSVAYMGEEVTYAVALLRKLLLIDTPSSVSLFRAAYIFVRLSGLAYIFLRLRRSVRRSCRGSESHILLLRFNRIKFCVRHTGPCARETPLQTALSVSREREPGVVVWKAKRRDDWC